VPYLRGPHWRNPRLQDPTATAIVWSTATCAVIAIGAEAGAAVIGTTAQEVEVEIGMGAGAITVITDMARASGSKAEISALG
jgi:hypothetical protein